MKLSKKSLSYLCVLICSLICISSFCSAQNQAITINGIIRKKGGEALPNATVKLVGKNIAKATGDDGKFSITATIGSSIEISYIGYFTKVLKIKDASYIDVVLEENFAAHLDDIVVIGYGKQKQPTVTGAVGVISGNDLVQTPVANISNMLIGRTSGIGGVQASGEPGMNTTAIRIRGIATLNVSDPLIVIDGVQQPAEQPYAILNAIDPNEVENISILKDASATAVYGIRGANGVIIVTTKRGKTNRPQFSFSANQGFTKATSLFETINSYEFASLRNELIRNTQSFGDQSFNALLFSNDELWKFQNNRDYTPTEVDLMTFLTAEQKETLRNSPALYYTSHDFYKEQFGGTGTQSNYNLNASGGTTKIKYFTSLGYFQQSGILSNTSYGGADNNSNYKRYNFRSNFDIEVAKNFQLSFNIGGQSTVNKVAGSGGSASDFSNRYQSIIQNILENSPFVGPGIVDGKLVTGFIGLPGDPTNPLAAKGGTGTSSIAQLLTGGSWTVYTTTLNTAMTLKHTMNYVTKGLESHLLIAYDDSYTKGFRQTNSVPTYSAMRDPTNPGNILFIGGIVNPTSTGDNQGNSTWRKIYMEAAVNYNRTFTGGHAVSGLFLANAQRYTANGQAFNIPSGLMGLVGRTTYNYKERYLLEFSMGLNGTENFAAGQRFGYFPAISGGWIASNEPFFPKNRIVTWAKIRGSYGEVGNDQIGGRRYLYLPNTWTINSSGYFYGSSNGSSYNPYIPGAAESALGNPNVTWERARKMNISVDLRMFGDKLSLTGSVFSEKRNNILVTLGNIPGTFGVPQWATPPLNLGKVSNRGFEIEMNWNDKVGNVTYFIKGNCSFAKNKVDYKAEALYPYPWMNETGFAIGQYKGYLTNGFYNTQEELNNRPYNAGGNNARLGDIKYVDVNGDGIINQSDQVPIGYANMPQVNYNLSIGFSYKGFDVNALFIGTAKGSFPQYGYILNTPFAKTTGQVLRSAYEGRWTPEKYASGATITYPSMTFNGGGPNVFSDFWLKSNNFKRLKNLEVGYTFKGKGLLGRANIRGIRVYANGNNLFTWDTTILKGIDPEQADAGKNNNGYLFPLTKTFNFGLNIQF